jgi:hypothetical protein
LGQEGGQEGERGGEAGIELSSTEHAKEQGGWVDQKALQLGSEKKRKKLSACRGEGSVVGPLLAAHALLLRCDASAMLNSSATANYLGHQPRNLCLRIDVRECRYYRLEKLLILCLHPRCRSSILRRAIVTNFRFSSAAVCLVFLVGNLVYFPLLFTLPWMYDTAGVSGFEGSKVRADKKQNPHTRVKTTNKTGVFFGPRKKKLAPYRGSRQYI